ncbi:MAG: phenylalanine--tRNA ligase subunit beta, partial [Bdellovibrionota bacterium]
MKISLNWLADYIDVAPIRADLKGVFEKLTLRGIEVENVSSLAKGFEKVIVASLDAREKHPNSDRLSVCRVNTGSEALQIVCGAQNMKAGDKVALSMIGAELPNGLKIQKGKIRDVESFGMLCSEQELGLADESEGILILPQNAPVGKPLAEFLGRDDVVIELNITPNRGDALSHIGVARELASILGQKVKLPKASVNEIGGNTSEKVRVALQNPTDRPHLCIQYHARYVEGVKIGPSPEWLQKRLQAIGLRPINNVVDVTNFVLMEWGQPLHAFDYSQIKGSHIQTRVAKENEVLPLLDGTTVTLHPEDLVIADQERAIALAGVMGGGNSEVTETTTALLLEAAQFLPSTVRKSARRHQKHSDSSHRFERQVDARAVTLAMERATQLIVELAGGRALKGVVSQYSPLGEQLVKDQLKTISVSVPAFNQFSGLELTKAQVHECLNQLGFTAKASGDVLVVQVPSYRPDVETQEDVYEEVLRVWGYDKVPVRVPRLDFMPEATSVHESKSKALEKLKLAFVEQGFSEAVNFAFTSKTSNEEWGGPEKGLAVSLQNPLNEDLTTLKTSLLGGLLDNLLSAVRHQQKDTRLFEVRPVYFRDEKAETGVREEWRVAALASGRSYSHALAARDRVVDFYDFKGVLEVAVENLGVRGLRFMPVDSAKPDARLHPAQTVQVALGKGPCGVLGRLHPLLESKLKLREPLYWF